MPTRLRESFDFIVKNKAQNIISKPKYKIESKRLLNELGIETPESEKAFVVGAIEAMIFDIALSLNLLKYAEYKSRHRLTKEILKENNLL